MAFPTGWNRQCVLTIQASQIPASLTDFPVLLTEATLPTEILDSTSSYPAQSDAGDIRFSTDSAGATQLACEIVSFTQAAGAGGTCEIFVKVPSVSSSINTTIYIWYNTAGTDSQPAFTDTYGRNNVWDSNFLFVLHMNEDPSGTAPQMIDSTGNGYDGTSAGTMTTTDLVAGQVGNCLDLDGSNDYINLGLPNLSSLTGFTAEAWVNPGSSGSTDTLLSNWEATPARASILFRLNSSLVLYGYAVQQTDTQTGGAFSDLTLTGSAWNYCEFSLRSGNLTASLNDSTSSTTYGFSGGMDATAGVADMWIGSSPHNSSDFLLGKIDEVRFSIAARSTDWRGATYNNQNSPSTFVVEGTPAIPGGTSWLTTNFWWDNY